MTISAALANGHAANQGATRAEPAWLSTFRKHHLDAFAQEGLPNPANEYWKYTDLSARFANDAFALTAPAPLLAPSNVHDPVLKELIARQRLNQAASALVVLVDGCFVPGLSALDALANDVRISPLTHAVSEQPDWLQSHWPATVCPRQFPFACLNAALFQEGLFIEVLANRVLDAPLHVLAITTGNVSVNYPRCLISLAKASQLTVFVENICLAAPERAMLLVSAATTITVAAGAQLNYLNLQRHHSALLRFNYTKVIQHNASSTKVANFVTGGNFMRDDLVIDLKEAGAACHTSGFYRSQAALQCVDHHIAINHLAPQTQSSMLYKGIIDDHTRAVFNGRVYVAPEAQQVSAYQANHHLLLSANAEVYAKPELEIYADDVKCKHGATIGQMDPLRLFYLNSRGIPLTLAQAMLREGFAHDVLQQINNGLIKQRIEQGIHDAAQNACAT